MAKKKPAQVFRLGPVRAAVWLNQNGKGDAWHTVTITVSYKDGDEWKETTGYRKKDLPLVSKSSDMAHMWILNQEAKTHLEQAPADEVDE